MYFSLLWNLKDLFWSELKYTNAHNNVFVSECNNKMWLFCNFSMNDAIVTCSRTRLIFWETQQTLRQMILRCESPEGSDVVCLCRCFSGVRSGVGLLHGLHGCAGQRSAAGRGRGPTQTQWHPLSLLPSGGHAAITAAEAPAQRSFNPDPVHGSTKALVKPDPSPHSRTYSTDPRINVLLALDQSNTSYWECAVKYCNCTYAIVKCFRGGLNYH